MMSHARTSKAHTDLGLVEERYMHAFDKRKRKVNYIPLVYVVVLCVNETTCKAYIPVAVRVLKLPSKFFVCPFFF